MNIFCTLVSNYKNSDAGGLNLPNYNVGFLLTMSYRSILLSLVLDSVRHDTARKIVIINLVHFSDSVCALGYVN